MAPVIQTPVSGILWQYIMYGNMMMQRLRRVWLNISY